MPPGPLDPPFKVAVSPDTPIWPVVREVTVRPEWRRWMAAPGWSANRLMALPSQKKVGWLSAAWILLRAWSAPTRDNDLSLLGDIEDLIVAGHSELALERIETVAGRRPELMGRCLGLKSLAHYDLQDEKRAVALHRLALSLDGAHPVMIEIFGTEKDD